MFNFIIYADDTTLFSTIETFRDSVQNKSTESVINELLKIVEWLNINKLSLNKSKSKYMTFQMPNKTTLTLSLKINNIDIEKVHAITIKLFNLYTCTQAYTHTGENNT